MVQFDLSKERDNGTTITGAFSPQAALIPSSRYPNPANRPSTIGSQVHVMMSSLGSYDKTIERKGHRIGMKMTDKPRLSGESTINLSQPWILPSFRRQDRRCHAEEYRSKRSKPEQGSLLGWETPNVFSCMECLRLEVSQDSGIPSRKSSPIAVTRRTCTQIPTDDIGEAK